MLRCFCVVAEKGSLQAAAEHLGRTPSAVSMLLKQLEEHLNGRLFETDRKNRLTDLGRYVFRQASNELSHFDATVHAVETYARNPKGVLRVAAVPSMISDFVVPSVEEFCAKYPDVKVDVRDMDSRSVVDSLASGFVEIGFASWLEHIRGIGNKPLVQDDFGLVCHADHPLAKSSDPIHLGNLQTDKFVSNDLCSAIDDADLSKFLQATRISAQNTLSLMEFLNSGNWYTILPSSVVAISPGTLFFRRIENLTAKRTISLLFRIEFETVPYFAEFLEIAERRVGEVRAGNTPKQVG